MTKEQIQERRKQMFDQLELMLQKKRNPEDRLFYHHSSEDRIVLSHAMFWVMTRSVKGKIAKEKYLLLLHQYQEKMLDAYLTEDASFPDFLHYCNIIFECLPTILNGTYSLRTDKDARKLAAISVVASGYAGDMPEPLCNEFLDDMDFHYNKVKCPKIDQMLPQLNAMVEQEERAMFS